MPSVAGSLIGAGVAVVFGVIWISMASRMGAPGFFPLFGVLFIVVAIAMGAVSLSKANAYQRSRQNYERQRRRLVDQFHRPGGKPD